MDDYGYFGKSSLAMCIIQNHKNGGGGGGSGGGCFTTSLIVLGVFVLLGGLIGSCN